MKIRRENHLFVLKLKAVLWQGIEIANYIEDKSTK